MTSTDTDPWKDFRVGLPSTGSQAPQADAVDPYAAFRTGPAALTAPPPDAPDKYRAAAIADRQKLIDAGVAPPEGYGRLLTHGGTLGFSDELAAAAETPIQMFRKGTWSIPEAYRYAKAGQDLALEKSRELPLATAHEIAGGLTTGAGVLGSGTRLARPAVNYAANVVKAGGVGAIAGAGEAPTLADVPAEAGMGTLLGMGVGAAAPLVTTTVGAIARPFVNRLRDPEKIATEHIAKVARDAGISPQQLVTELTESTGAGQPYFAADVFGKEGQRKLAGVAKVPGEQRELITRMLTDRQLDMPTRTGAEVGRALGTPGTAEAAQTALIDQASTQAGPIYRAAERIPTWSEKLQPFLDDPIARQGLAHGNQLQRIRSVGTDRPYNPRDAMITGTDPTTGFPIVTGVPNMQTLHTLKVGLDRMIENAVNPATGRLNAEGNAIKGFRDRMLAEIDPLNPTYALARQMYGGPMRVKEAIDTGRDMARRGLAADTVPAFRALPPTEQQGVRIGYADAIREPLERTGNFPTILRQKSAKGSQELAALADNPDRLRQFLNREEQMQRTHTAALGGPATAENLADMGASPGGLPEAMSLATSAAHGNALGFAKNAYDIAARLARGETEKQRMAITQALLTREPSAAQALADRLAAYELRRRGVNPMNPNLPPRYGP